MAMVPLRYNLRNLRVRWVTTLLTVLVTAVVVCCSCVLFGLVEGLNHSQMISGEPLDVLILRKGATGELDSTVDLEKAQELATLPGIARGGPLDAEAEAKGLPDLRGKPLVAGELIEIPVAERTDGSRTNLILRGVVDASPHLRPSFRIVEGRYLVPGRGECVVAAPISRRFKGARLGDVLSNGERESYRVVGLFTAGGSAAESEVWVARPDLAAQINAESRVSDVQIRAESVAARDAILEAVKGQGRFGGSLVGKTEADYYAEQQNTALFLTVLGTMIAILLTIGALFAAANTMFAAVKSRTREIGTMRALGFPRRAVLLSFLGESLILCALGGLLGWAATLPFQSFRLGLSDFNTFSERTVQLRFGPLVFAVAFGMTLAMGLFGGLFPAVRAVRLNVVKSLREL